MSDLDGRAYADRHYDKTRRSVDGPAQAVMTVMMMMMMKRFRIAGRGGLSKPRWCFMGSDRIALLLRGVRRLLLQAAAHVGGLRWVMTLSELV